MILRYDQGMNTHTDTHVKIIENAARADVRPGDHITWEQTQSPDGATIYERREGIAHHRDSFGDWCTEGGTRLASLSGAGITITIRRPIQELPTKAGTVIVPADGWEFIEVTTDNGETFRAREAVRHWTGGWYAAWRSGPETRGFVAPEDITPGTWKVGNR